MDVFQEEITFQKMGQASQAYIFDVGGDKSGILSEIVQKTGTENSGNHADKAERVRGRTKEAALSMQVEGEKKQDIEIRVSPKIYSEKRLERSFRKRGKSLQK